MLSFGASRLNTFSQGSILVSGASLLTSSRCFQNKRRYTRAGLTEASYQMEQITEADACEIIKAITPPLDKQRHKGQAGKIAVIGGCREYTGAPYFAAISALKIGADLSHIFCTEDAATVIKSYSPELIVHPVLQESYKIKYDEKNSVKRKVLEDVSKWIERFDGLVVGPGLGRDEFLLDCVADVIQLARLHKIPIVLDGDALFLITNSPDLVTGYPLAILTPNINEYKRLYQKMMDTEMTNKLGAGKCLKRLAERMGGITILQKGKEDIISDGNTVHVVNLFGSPRRCGGQGDILSGSVAVFSSWAIRQAENDVRKRAFKLAENAMLLGSISGSVLMRKAASIAFQQCKRSTVTGDIIGVLGKCMETISPAQ